MPESASVGSPGYDFGVGGLALPCALFTEITAEEERGRESKTSAPFYFSFSCETD